MLVAMLVCSLLGPCLDLNVRRLIRGNDPTQSIPSAYELNFSFAVGRVVHLL